MHPRIPATALFLLVLGACEPGATPDQGSPPETAPVPAQTLAGAPMPFELSEEQANGRVVYETMCWSCHGFAGRGDGPAVRAGAVAAPPDFLAGSLSGASVRRLQAAFQSEAGALDPGNPHMANVLSIVEVDDFSSAIGYLEALAYPPELPGSAIAGHRNYLLQCQSCHGATGRGDGAGADILEVAPANFLQDTLLAARDFQAVFDKIRSGGGGVHGSSMPAWGVMFEDGEIWDLVSYISSFQSGILSAPPGGGR